MEALTNEELAYQYYTIIRDEAVQEQNNLGDGILYVTFNQDDDNIREASNDPFSNGSFESLDSVNDLELNVNNDGEFLTSSALEDNYYDVIEPNLISGLDYNIGGDDEANTLMGEADADPGLQFLDFGDSNIAYNQLNSQIDSEKEASGFNCIFEGCDKVYATSYHLAVHMRTHVSPKPFGCPVEGCNKKLSSNFTMKNHLKIHTGERPYMCTTCSRAFKSSGELVKHARTHTGTKPFPCPIEGCDRSFTTNSIRKVHIRSHTGERPYLCQFPGCGKAFTSSANQKSHSRIHSGDKPFACTVKGCRKKFTEYSTMYKHSISHQNLPTTCNENSLEDLVFDISENNDTIFSDL